MLDAPHRGAEEHGQAKVRARVGTGDPELEPAVGSGVDDAQRAAVVPRPPGGRGRGPVAGAETAVGVGHGRRHDQKLGKQGHHPSHGGARHSRHIARRRLPRAGVRRLPLARTGWGGLRDPGKPSANWAMKVAVWPRRA